MSIFEKNYEWYCTTDDAEAMRKLMEETKGKRHAVYEKNAINAAAQYDAEECMEVLLDLAEMPMADSAALASSAGALAEKCVSMATRYVGRERMSGEEGERALASAIDASRGDSGLSTVKALLAAGASPKKGEVFVESPVSRAAKRGLSKIVEALLSAVGGRWTSEREGLGVNALHRAAEKGCAECVRLLTEAGVSPNERNGLGLGGQSPLHILAASGDEEIVDAAKILISFGASVNGKDENGDTPLHCLAKNVRMKFVEENVSCEKMVDLLVSAGAAVDAKNKAGETPVERAVKEGSWLVASALLRGGAEKGYVPMFSAEKEDRLSSKIKSFYQEAEALRERMELALEAGEATKKKKPTL